MSDDSDAKGVLMVSANRVGFRLFPGWDTIVWLARVARFKVRFILTKVWCKSRYAELVFTTIHKKNVWNDSESRSGTGSSLQQTEVLRHELARLLRDLGAASLLDLPCGDFNWMKEVDLPRDLTYLGGDIIEELIARNTARYGSRRISFQTMDVLRDQLPTVDVVLCRDCLVHFSFADIFRAIANLKRSGSTYLLTTHFANRRENRNILTGEWRPLCLTAPPLSFCAPLLTINERCTEGNGKYSDKTLALCRISGLPEGPRLR